MSEAIRVWGAAIVGRRESQQDAFHSEYIEPLNAWLLIVADGMGGHAAGATASNLAIQAFREALFEACACGEAPGSALSHALEQANISIAQWQQTHPETTGMGTTLTALIVSKRELSWISVGDSPLWLLRNKRLKRLNADHSLRSLGERFANSPNANALQSAVTGGKIELIDCREHPFSPRNGDAFLLASDGLLTLSESEVAKVMARNLPQGPENAVRHLLAKVSEVDKPRQDNCTALLAVLPGFRRYSRMKIIAAGFLAACALVAALAWFLRY